MHGHDGKEHPPPGIGIKAKLCHDGGHDRDGASAPRNWNQGKATGATSRTSPASIRPPELESRQSYKVEYIKPVSSIRPPELESRQSTGQGIVTQFDEHPPPGIGIKAKQMMHWHARLL